MSSPAQPSFSVRTLRILVVGLVAALLFSLLETILGRELDPVLILIVGIAAAAGWIVSDQFRSRRRPDRT